MDDTVAWIVLGVLALVLVGLICAVTYHIRWLFREDRRRDWQYAQLVYRLRDELRAARDDDTLPR